MSRRDGVHWYCPNRDCSWSFVAEAPREEGFAQRCVCGTVMRKGQAVPAFRYLDFLHEEPEVQEEVAVGKG
jgi:hypothetical protein